MKGQSSKIIILKIITMITILIGLTCVLSVQSNAKLENEDEIIARVKKENEDNPESTAYLITDEYICNVLPETSIGTLKSNIEEEVKVYENVTKQTEISDGIIKTGMVLEFLQNGRTFGISVLGDLNKDGILNQIELTREIRDVIEATDWKIEDKIEILSGDIDRNKSIDLDDIDIIINYIVFDRLEIAKFEKVSKPEVKVISGDFKEDRYESDVEISIAQKQENASKTVYKITGSAEREYKEIDKTDTVKIETDGVFKITAYTYGKDGNKSKGESIIIIRQKTTYAVKYSAGTHGTFDTQEIDKLYIGDDMPKFSGEIVGNPGYRFIGWNEEISEKVEGNIEYVAKWEAIEYKLAYDLNGGLLEDGKENPSTYTVETENFTLINPTKFGYKFLGWSENGSEEIRENVTIEKGSMGEKTYTAKWEALSGIVYFVKTYTMDINGEYQEKIIEYSGSTDEEIKLDTTPEPGFTYEEELSTPTGVINPDGSTELVIYFSRNKYSIKIIAGYGTENIFFIKEADNKSKTSDTEIVEEIYYETPIIISAGEKQGYTWNTWISNNQELVENSKDKPYKFTTPAGDLEITASCTINQYKLEYNLNGGSLEEGKENPSTYTVETENFVFNNPIKEGYTFIGWSVNGGENIAEELMIEKGTIGDFVLEANYTPNTDTKYTVVVHRMNTAGVYEVETTEEKHGITDEIITAIVNDEEGFTFNEERSNITGRILPDGSLVLNIYLERNKYNLILHKENGIEFDNCDSATYYYGEEIALNAIVNAGYTWNKWDGGETPEFSSNDKEYSLRMPAKNLTITAKSILNIYNISYNLNGGTVNSANPTTYTVESETFTLNKPTKVGYVFVGWTGSNGTNASKEVTINRGTIENKTYTANWTESTGTKYKITVYKMNTSGSYVIESSTEYTGTTNAPISANTTATTGFTYEASRSTATGTIAPDGSSELKVYFSRNRYKLTLSKDIGVSTVTGENTYYYEQEVVIDSTLLPGYTWSKWTSNNTTLIPESTTKRHTVKILAGDVTLTANTTPNTYTVTFDANGGNCTTANKSVTYNGTYGTLPTATRNGYTFNGWYTSSNGGMQRTASTVVSITANETLYAQWTPVPYTITYNLGGGSVSTANPTTYTVETNTITLNNPTRNGYTFTGWTGSNGNTVNKTVSIAKGSTGNKTYTANWTPISYTITYNLGGGTVNPANPTTYTIETNSFTLNNPTRNGYAFTGWTGSNGSTASTSVLVAKGSTGNKTYTANWSAITYTITYNANGGSGAPSTQTKNHGTAISLSTTEPTRADYMFLGWSTSSSATTATYKPGATYNVEGNLTLYAVWKYAVITFTNGHDLRAGGYAQPNYVTSSATIPDGAKISYMAIILPNRVPDSGQIVNANYSIRFGSSTITSGQSYGNDINDGAYYTTTTSGTLTLMIQTQEAYYGNNYASATAYLNINKITDVETGKDYILR